MAVRLTKPWLALSAENVARLTGHLGVYQLAVGEDIVYIGVAGGRTMYGLKGELRSCLEEGRCGATHFRLEVTMSYRSRHFELLQVHVHDHGQLPSGNTDIDAESLGRLRPA